MLDVKRPPRVYYKDNPNLKRIKVVTRNGAVEYAVNCNRTPNGYEVIRDEKPAPKDNGKMAIDHLTGEEKKVSAMVHGIVKVENGVEILGYFTINPYTACTANIRGNILFCIDYKILDPVLYVESLAEGVYYKVEALSSYAVRMLNEKRLALVCDNKQYNAEDDKEAYAMQCKLFAESVFPIDKDLKYIGRYLGDISFGAEFETTNGTLPEWLRCKYGIIICKDGSTKLDGQHYPPEYVTVPLKGAKGLQTLRDISKEIQKRSEISINCSHHLHLGGFKLDRMLFVSLYKLCYKIQKDIFRMFPYYKTKPEGIKQKNYCKQLPDILSSYNKGDFNTYINESYKDLYKYLTGGIDYEGLNAKDRKQNPWGEHKWNIKTRYHWVNFVNPIFGKRDTIEFRIHTPTLNSDKIINWLLMCTAIIKFAENNVRTCVTNAPVTFKDVLNFYTHSGKHGGILSEKLNAYYNDRVTYFEADYKKGDYVSNNDLLSDSTYSFNVTKF